MNSMKWYYDVFIAMHIAQKRCVKAIGFHRKMVKVIDIFSRLIRNLPVFLFSTHTFSTLDSHGHFKLGYVVFFIPMYEAYILLQTLFFPKKLLQECVDIVHVFILIHCTKNCGREVLKSIRTTFKTIKTKLILASVK